MDVGMWNEKQRKSRAVTSEDLRHRLNLRHSAKRFKGRFCWPSFLTSNCFLVCVYSTVRKLCIGTRTLVSQPCFGVFFLYYQPVYTGNAPIELENVRDTYKRHLERNRKSSSWCWFMGLKQITCYILGGAPEFWCWLSSTNFAAHRTKKIDKCRCCDREACVFFLVASSFLSPCFSCFV